MGNQIVKTSSLPICVTRWFFFHQETPTMFKSESLHWHHNEHNGVSNHQPHDCLLKRLFRRRSKKTSKLRVTVLCAGNSPGTGEFPAQRDSYVENVSIWWRHHDNHPSNLLFLYQIFFWLTQIFFSLQATSVQVNRAPFSRSCAPRNTNVFRRWWQTSSGLTFPSTKETLKKMAKVSFIKQHVSSQWCHISIMGSEITANLTRLFNSLVQSNNKEIIRFHYWPFVRGIHWKPVDSPHKRPVIYIVFLCHNIIMS